MHRAHVIRLDGVELPCLLLTPHDEIPEQLVVDFGDRQQRPDLPKAKRTYRLEPSSTQDPEPQYRELFEE